MIGFSLLLGAYFSDFPEWEGEFEEYSEVYTEDPRTSALPEIIAEQENREALLAYVENHEASAPYISDPEVEDLLIPLLAEGSTVVDFGMGLSPFLAKYAEKVHAFEHDPEAFSKRYWQLMGQNAKNVSLYCTVLRKVDQTLDEYFLKGVSLICVHCGGREDLFLKGARFTIEKQKPSLLINLIGGLSFEQGDRFVKEEMDRRIDEIIKKGYEIRRIRGDLHLALPL